MDIKFLTNIDLNGNQLNNAVIQNLTTNPTTGNVQGRVFYNSNTSRIMLYTKSGYKHLLDNGDLSVVNGDIGDLSDRIDILESTLQTITGTDTDDVINKWEEIVAFIDGTEGTTLDGILASYVTIGTEQTITGTKTFSNVVLCADAIAGSADDSWQINHDGAASFTNVNASLINGYTPLTIGNTTFSQSLTSGTKIGEITIGDDDPVNIYAPSPTAVVNNLTSTSTTSALSAAQGKVLNDKFANYVTLGTAQTIGGSKTFTSKLRVDDGIAGYDENNLDIWSIETDGKAYFKEINLTTALPITEGGTGATTAAQARTNLGLGDAAVKGVSTTVSSGSTDLITSGAVYSALSTLSTVVAESFTKDMLTANGSSGYTYKLSRTDSETVAAGVMLYDNDYNLVYTAISTGGGGTLLHFTASVYASMSGTWSVHYLI